MVQNNTKSLNEQIKEVVDMKGVSRRDKVEMLVKLGLRENEVCFVLPTTPHVSSPRFAYTFGVEIECNMPQDRFMTIANRENVPYRFESYNHSDNRSYFKFVSDGSIQPTMGMVGDPIECVSPVLNGNKSGFDMLKNCCDALNEAGAYVNRSTGLHVHIGVEGITDEHYVNVFKNYQKLELVIDSFMAVSRRSNNGYYCGTLRDHNFDWCNTKASVSVELDNCRYHKVNPKSWLRHQTIEFRQHQGTVNFTKIKNWVNFCSKLVAWSKNNVLTADVQSINEIPFLTAAEKRFFTSRKEELARA